MIQLISRKPLASKDVIYSNENVQMTLDKAETEYKKQELLVGLESLGNVHLTLDANGLILSDAEKGTGLAIQYDSVILHAIIAADSNTPKLMLQLDARKIQLPDGTCIFEADFEEDEQSDCDDDGVDYIPSWEITLTLASKEKVEELFKTISENWSTGMDADETDCAGMDEEEK